MPSTYYPAQIEQLKRQAKASARSLGISHSSALDQIAHDEGFANWSLLMRHHHDSGPRHFVRSEEQWKVALRPTDGAEPRFPATYGARFEAINAEFVSSYHATSFAVEYVTSLLTRPRYRVHPRSLAYVEMRWWLPYGLHETEDGSGTRILLNRYYKPVGYGINEFVRYTTFPNVQARLGFEQLKAFSNRGEATGYLFDDGNPPWRKRVNATEYLARLERLRRILCETPAADAHSAWTHTRQEIFDVLAPWAQIATWGTSNPADERRFDTVLTPLKGIANGAFSDADLTAALRAHRGQNIELVGGEPSDATLDRVAQRIMQRLRDS